MRVVALYHPRSEHGGVIEDFARDYRVLRGRKLNLMSLESREGAATASLYDITSYPAILALAGDGSVQNIWQGLPLPLMQELDPYSQEFRDGLMKSRLARA